MALRVRVCAITDVVAGELRAFVVEGVTWPVMVSLVDGVVVAVPGVCPHDDVSLADYGVLDGRTLTCRVHGYRFDVLDGHCEHMPRLELRRYRVTLLGGDVWADLL